jgi:hypothetical protein
LGIERGNSEATPVRVENTENLQSAFVAGALGALASEAGAPITDKQLANGVRHLRAMMGSTT